MRANHGTATNRASPEAAPADRGMVTDRAVRAIILRAALTGERGVSVARLLFCTAIGVRSSLLWADTSAGNELPRALVTYPALAAAIAFSLYTLFGVRPTLRSERVLVASVAVDAVVCFVSLLPSPLWPWQGYLGLTNMPDMAAILLITFAAGLRHSPRAAIVGAALNAVSYAALVAVDYSVTGNAIPALVPAYTLYGIFIVGAGALAVVLAVGTRRMVERAARAAVQADQAGRNLRVLLRDHHDVRSLLSSAQLNAELVARALGDGAPDELSDAKARLLHDLGDVNRLIDDVKVRTYAELVALESRQPADVAHAIDEALAAVRGRFPEVRLVREADATVPAARIAGGEATLSRVVFNLLVNACEGDGRRGASAVRVHTAAPDGHIRIQIDDDGPGFDGAGPTSSKPGSLGLGLELVGRIVDASGGTMRCASRDEGGARVVIELPRA